MDDQEVYAADWAGRDRRVIWVASDQQIPKLHDFLRFTAGLAIERPRGRQIGSDHTKGE